MQNLYKETMKGIINRQAERLYKVLNLSPGFSTDKVVTDLGGEIVHVKEVEDNADAQITPNEEGNSFRILCVNKEIDEEYVRLAVAHELGHLFLHMSKITDSGKYVIEGTYAHKNISSSMVEWEAEEFALAFLMPENVFINAVEEAEGNEKIVDKIQWLADEFKVPFKSVIVRRKSLGI